MPEQKRPEESDVNDWEKHRPTATIPVLDVVVQVLSNPLPERGGNDVQWQVEEKSRQMPRCPIENPNANYPGERGVASEQHVPDEHTPEQVFPQRASGRMLPVRRGMAESVPEQLPGR